MAAFSKRWVLIFLVLFVLAGASSPLLVTWYHNGVVQDNQNAAIDALAEFAKQQNELFKKKGHYAASFQELGGEWAKVQDFVSRNPTDFNGYRFRLFTSQSGDAKSPDGGTTSFLDEKGRLTKSYAIVAVPAHYGFTGRFTFFLSAPGKPVYYYDYGVKTDTTARQMSEYSVPPGAGELK